MKQSQQHPRFAASASSTSLRKQLGAGDVRTVNQYTDEIREIERRIQLAAKASSDVPELDLPPGIPEQFDEHIKLHFDLLALAFKADITRVATLLGARDLTGRELSRSRRASCSRRAAPASASTAARTTRTTRCRFARYARLNRYHVSTMAYLAEKLKAIPDGDGTLLDHSLILYGTNMGNSNQHQHYDVPHILVGGANGKLKGNRHLAYERKTVHDRQPAAQRAGHVRHPEGEAGRQHRAPAEARLGRERRMTIASVVMRRCCSLAASRRRCRRLRRRPERRCRRRDEGRHAPRSRS